MNSFLSVLNAEEFVVGDLVCPPETAMFMGGPSETTINTNLQVTRDLEYRFLVRDESWNKLFHPTPGLGWQYVNEAADGGGFRIFDVDSFDELFHFEP
jgi:hypothetical protein